MSNLNVDSSLQHILLTMAVGSNARSISLEIQSSPSKNWYISYLCTTPLPATKSMSLQLFILTTICQQWKTSKGTQSSYSIANVGPHLVMTPRCSHPSPERMLLLSLFSTQALGEGQALMNVLSHRNHSSSAQLKACSVQYQKTNQHPRSHSHHYRHPESLTLPTLIRIRA